MANLELEIAILEHEIRLSDIKLEKEMTAFALLDAQLVLEFGANFEEVLGI